MPAIRPRFPRPPPLPVKIYPLVILDCLLSFLLIWGGSYLLRETSSNSKVAAVALLALGLLHVLVGGALFFRRHAVYVTSLVVHALFMVAMVGWTIYQCIAILVLGDPFTILIPVLGCNGLVVSLYGSCSYHAWRLIRENTQRLVEIRLLQEEAEIQASPGWDEGKG